MTPSASEPDPIPRISDSACVVVDFVATAIQTVDKG